MGLEKDFDKLDKILGKIDKSKIIVIKKKKEEREPAPEPKTTEEQPKQQVKAKEEEKEKKVEEEKKAERQAEVRKGRKRPVARKRFPRRTSAKPEPTKVPEPPKAPEPPKIEQKPEKAEEEKPQEQQKPETPTPQESPPPQIEIYTPKEESEVIRKLTTSPKAQKQVEKPQQPEKKEAKVKKIKMGDEISIKELSQVTGIKKVEIIRKLKELGVDISGEDDLIDFDTAQILCADWGIEVEKEVFDESKYIDMSPDPEEKKKPKPPVIVVLGHVDHGKTTLLDAIRQTNVAEKEYGGITQKIGAYVVNWQGKDITFIDTPGHEAFTAMRARGAKVADIAILVVAADEGVKPQTVEAIDHAKAAGIPIIVAINKIDKPGANPEMVKNQLAEYGLIPEEWGGDTFYSLISAKQKKGIDDLLDKIITQAELIDPKANPDRPAEGFIIESRLEKGLGIVASVIIERGTLRKGDIIVAGTTWGRVRNIFSDKRQVIKEVKPGYPAEIVFGGDEPPPAGEKIYVVKDDDTAKLIVEERKKQLEKPAKPDVSLEKLFEKIKESDEIVELPLIIKADSQGALDAIEKGISSMSFPQVKFKIIRKGLGNITESDVQLAKASGAIVFGFNVKPDKNAQELARRDGVEVRTYRVIYEIFDDLKDAVKGKVKPKEVEVFLGKAKVLKIFKLSVGRVAGCKVEQGELKLGANVRVKRNGDVVGTGVIKSLKILKDSVEKVKEGNECGVIVEGVKVKEDDIIECYEIRYESPI